MTNDEVRKLALSLLHADSEQDIERILKQKNLWDNPDSWRLYGDRDSNYSVIGNQQSRPDAALVEKVVNSVDARLMKECLARRIDPSSEAAPQSVREAVGKFIDKVEEVGERKGNIRFWNDRQRNEESRKITIALTGSRGSASITIADLGEGQTPEAIPDTFLSIDRGNKLRTPFVQGKFNMGGTGALKFCGTEGLQLIITRRCPDLLETHSGPEANWSFTVVRRFRPVSGSGEVRNSVYRFLAPVGAEERPKKGQVLQFDAPSINALPEKNRAYVRALSWGSVLKLYEYDVKGSGSHALRRSGLKQRLELMLPDIALPVRIHECRQFRGEASKGSFDTNLVGLSARLESSPNLEEDFPTSIPLQIRSHIFKVRVYAFKSGKADTYRSTEGVLFTVSGQTHATLPKQFFNRTRVRMGRLKDSLLIVVDCSELSTDVREDLFMNSRDRLSDCALRKEMEEELENLIAEHSGLKQLREQRRREEVDQNLEDDKPLEGALNEIFQTSPSLRQLFLQGQRLNRPYQAAGLGGANNGRGQKRRFEGKPHPTFFRFEKNGDADTTRRNVEQGRRCRVKFETDVVNDYFDRLSVPGHYDAIVLDRSIEAQNLTNSLTLYNGIANWSFSLPDDLDVGEEITFRCIVNDDTLSTPFIRTVVLKFVPKQSSPSSGTGSRDQHPNVEDPDGQGSGHGGTGRDRSSGIQFPEICEVKEGDPIWSERCFDYTTGCQVVDDSDPGKEFKLKFYINMSNRAFETELKHSREDPAVVKKKFIFANVLTGLGIFHDSQREGANETDPHESPEERVASVTRALAPFLLPMINSLGSLSADDDLT